MKCAKTYYPKWKESGISVHWCGVITMLVLVAAFVIAERLYGPF